MYAIEIGLNFALAKGRFSRLENMLDHSSTKGRVDETAHIHCWHTKHLFSKVTNHITKFIEFKFRRDQYKDVKNTDEYDPGYIPHYCLLTTMGKFEKSDIIKTPFEFAIEQGGSKWWDV